MTEIGKYGFIYIWRDKKYKRYYIGCHWGTINDSYICSSPWMKKAHKKRSTDFKRRIIKSDLSRMFMYVEEKRYLDMIKKEEIKPFNPTPRYYNLYLNQNTPWHIDPYNNLTVGQKISQSKKGKTPKRDDKDAWAKSIKDAKIAKRKQISIDEMKSLFESGKNKIQVAEILGVKHYRITQEVRDNNIDVMELKRKSFPIKPEKMTTEEQGKQHSMLLKERWNNIEWKENQIMKLKKGSKNRYSDKNKTCEWIITFPNGNMKNIFNLSEFCRNEGLSLQERHRLCRGSLSKGYKAIKLNIVKDIK